MSAVRLALPAVQMDQEEEIPAVAVLAVVREVPVEAVERAEEEEARAAAEVQGLPPEASCSRPIQVLRIYRLFRCNPTEALFRFPIRRSRPFRTRGPWQLMGSNCWWQTVLTTTGSMGS